MMEFGKARVLFWSYLSLLLALQVPSQEMGSLDDDQDSVPGLDGSRRMFQGLWVLLQCQHKDLKNRHILWFVCASSGIEIWMLLLENSQ
jgi:hypothetical protein